MITNNQSTTPNEFYNQYFLRENFTVSMELLLECNSSVIISLADNLIRGTTNYHIT